MPTRALVAAALLVSLPGSSCGEEDAPAPPPSSAAEVRHARAEIARDITAMYRAWSRGEGEEACEYLTDRGQVRLVEAAAEFELSTRPLRCSETFEQIAAEHGIRLREKFTASEVHLDEGNETGEAACEERGAIQVSYLDGDWAVEVPWCVD